MNKFREWQVNVSGKSNGLTLPANYRVLVDIYKFEALDDDTYELYLNVCTFETSAYANMLPNDDFVNNKAIISFETLPTSGPANMIKTEIEKIFDASPNVGVGNYTVDPV